MFRHVLPSTGEESEFDPWSDERVHYHPERFDDAWRKRHEGRWAFFANHQDLPLNKQLALIKTLNTVGHTHLYTDPQTLEANQKGFRPLAGGGGDEFKDVWRPGDPYDVLDERNGVVTTDQLQHWLEDAPSSGEDTPILTPTNAQEEARKGGIEFYRALKKKLKAAKPRRKIPKRGAVTIAERKATPADYEAFATSAIIPAYGKRGAVSGVAPHPALAQPPSKKRRVAFPDVIDLTGSGFRVHGSGAQYAPDQEDGDYAQRVYEAARLQRLQQQEEALKRARAKAKRTNKGSYKDFKFTF